MKSDVVVIDCWWNHELMIELLLDCVVDANTCFGYQYIWSCDQVVFVWWIIVKWWCCCDEMIWVDFLFWFMSFEYKIGWEETWVLCEKSF
jgi:hypothetical protein